MPKNCPCEYFDTSDCMAENCPSEKKTTARQKKIIDGKEYKKATFQEVMELMNRRSGDAL